MSNLDGANLTEEKTAWVNQSSTVRAEDALRAAGQATGTHTVTGHVNRVERHLWR